LLQRTQRRHAQRREARTWQHLTAEPTEAAL
jgi:hypothetical protein